MSQIESSFKALKDAEKAFKEAQAALLHQKQSHENTLKSFGMCPRLKWTKEFPHDLAVGEYYLFHRAGKTEIDMMTVTESSKANNYYLVNGAHCYSDDSRFKNGLFAGPIPLPLPEDEDQDGLLNKIIEEEAKRKITL